MLCFAGGDGRDLSREQTAARQLGRRSKLAEIIAAAEKVKSEPWEAFRDHYGDWGWDWGRDMVLYLSRRHCGFKLADLRQAVGELSMERGRFVVLSCLSYSGRYNRRHKK